MRVRVHEFEEAFDDVVNRCFTHSYGYELTRISEFRFHANRRKAYDRFFLWHNDSVGSPYIVVEIDESHHKRDTQIERDCRNMIVSLRTHPTHFLRIRDSDFHNIEHIMRLFINFICISDDDVRLVMLSHVEKYNKLDMRLQISLRCVGLRFKRVIYKQYVIYAVKVAQDCVWDGYGVAVDGTRVGCYKK